MRGSSSTAYRFVRTARMSSSSLFVSLPSLRSLLGSHVMVAEAPLGVNDRCLLTELADGTGVVLHLDTKFYYTLNAAGVEVWKGIAAGARDAGQAADRLMQRFDVDSEAARRDVTSVLDYMLSEGLIVRSR